MIDSLNRLYSNRLDGAVNATAPWTSATMMGAKKRIAVCLFNTFFSSFSVRPIFAMDVNFCLSPFHWLSASFPYRSVYFHD